MKRLVKWLKESFKAFFMQMIIPALIILIIVVYFSARTFIFIFPGEAGVHWSRFFGGTEINYVYPEGFHLIFPWDQMYIYNVRIQALSFELDVLTRTGLQVHLNISTRYAPDYPLLGVLHQKVGPDYAQKVIIPEIESVLREIIGTMGAEQIYTTGRQVIVEAINQAIEQISQRYIIVDKVLITQITLPDSVAETIRYKIQQKHLIEAKEFKVEIEKKEAERKRIEGQGYRDQLKIVADALPPGEILKWRGIEATLALAQSNNSKVVIIGSGQEPFQLFGQVPLAPEDWEFFPNITSESAASASPEEPVSSIATPAPEPLEEPSSSMAQTPSTPPSEEVTPTTLPSPVETPAASEPVATDETRE